MRLMVLGMWRCALVFILLTAMSFVSFGSIPEKVVIYGNQNVNEESIKDIVATVVTPGPIDDKQIDRVLKALYATQLFADVRVNYSNNDILTITVHENELISDIVFDGNYSLSSSSLEKELQLKPRSILSPTKLREDINRILSVYQSSGYYNTTVEASLIKRPDGINVLLIKVNEGGKALIDYIEFLGNNNFDDETLRGILFSQPLSIVNFMGKKPRYDADIVGYNEELLRGFYTDRGFPDFKVVAAIAELNDDRTGIMLTFHVEEGKRYRIGSIKIESKLDDFNHDTVSNRLIVQTGSIYNKSELNSDMETISNAVNDLGYASATIVPEYSRHDDGTIDVVFSIKEAPKVYVNKVEITGNKRTMDKVIRRQISLSDGDPFSIMKVKKSYRKLSNLQYFEKVNIETIAAGSPDKIDLKINAEDKKTGEIYLSLSASTQDGIGGTVALDEKNFLGTGRVLNVSLQKSTYGSSAKFGWQDPYLLDYNIMGGFNIFYTEQTKRAFVQYDSSWMGFSTFTSFPVMENLSLSLTYSFNRNNIFDVEPGASIYIRDQEGPYIVSLMEYQLSYNHMDPYSTTSKGFYAIFKQGFTGIIGDSHYLRTYFAIRYVMPIFIRKLLNPWSFSIGFSSGYISAYSGSSVRINDRFFLGADDFRGFNFRGLGPRDRNSGDALGGHYMGKIIAQIDVPLVFKSDLITNSLGLKNYFFLDAGTLFGVDNPNRSILDTSQLRASFGVGVAFVLPVVGVPMRADLSFPFWRSNFDRVKYANFRFTN